MAETAQAALAASPLIAGESLNAMGFDMHYTPGKGSIGGWKNARLALNAEHDPSLHESAILLAKTMYEARNTENVYWISEHGGSGVLIQAMNILANQGAKLDKHYLYLSNPTTPTHKVVHLAVKLELKSKRALSHNKTFSPNEFVGATWGGADGYLTAYERWRHDKKNYTGLKFWVDAYKETVNLKGAGGTILSAGAFATGAAAAAGSALGISTAGMGTAVLAAVGISTSGAVIPALITVFGAIGVGMKVVDTVPKITQTLMPKLHKQIAKKL